MFYFFLYVYGDLRDHNVRAHSFPTRRSSDLAVLAAHEVHERAEFDDVDDLAVVNLADFGLFDDALDPDARRLDLADVGRGDLDHALVIDVDLGAGGGDDPPDHLAAGADGVTDLRRVDLHPLDARERGNAYCRERVCPPV